MHLSGEEKSVPECAKKAHHRWAFYCAIYFAVFGKLGKDLCGCFILILTGV